MQSELKRLDSIETAYRTNKFQPSSVIQALNSGYSVDTELKFTLLTETAAVSVALQPRLPVLVHIL